MQKGFAPIYILIGILILALVGGGYVYVKHPWGPISNGPLPAVSPPLHNPNESTNSAETANWKTYTNTEGGWMIKVPSDFNVINDIQTKEVNIVTLKSIDYKEDDSSCKGGCTYPILKGWILHIKTQENWNKGFDKSFFKSGPFPSPGIVFEEDKMINNMEVLIDQVGRPDLPNMNNLDLKANLVKGTIWYEITFSTDHSQQATIKDIFNQIISSFTFTDQIPQASATSSVGQHCGGFIQNAPTCPDGFHCQLNKIADTGGVCVKD